VDRNVDDEFELDRLHDSLPLYRQAQIHARQGVALDRSTLADWVEHAAFHLRPLHERLLTVLGARSKPFVDETTVPVLDPGRGRTKTGQLWAYAADDRPWGGLDPPGSAPIASEALNHIAAFYAIEKEIRGRSAEERRLVRQQKSRPRLMPSRPGSRQTGSHQPEDQSRRRHPLCPLALARLNALHRRRPHRTRQQYRRTINPWYQAPSQERAVCPIRRWR
jgi:transposase IS66 family protein